MCFSDIPIIQYPAWLAVVLVASFSKVSNIRPAIDLSCFFFVLVQPIACCVEAATVCLQFLVHVPLAYEKFRFRVFAAAPPFFIPG